jgi:hypothetical protein
MSELEQVASPEIVNPQTGEVLALRDATREEIAAWYLHLLELRGSMERVVREAERRFAELSDKETTLGVVSDGWRVSVPGAQDRFVPDKAALRAALVELAGEGVITQQAADEACRPLGVECPACGEFIPNGEFKLSTRALNALRKVKAVETIIDSCGEYVEPSRNFSVKRA